MSNTRQVMQQALRALEKAQVRADMYAVDNAIDALRAALAEPEHRSPNELLLDELLQNSIKLNKELVQAIKDIQKTVNDEESAQAIAQAVLKNVGINQ